MNRLLRFLDSFRRELGPDPLTPVRPIVTPDPDAAAALERRRAELAYRPEVGFLSDDQPKPRGA